MVAGKVAARIVKLKKSDETFLIAIDGRSGSGKTTFAEKLKVCLQNARVIHLDDFDMYEVEKSKLIKQVLEPLRTRKETDFVIIEGVFSLSKEFNSYYDYKIWIDCPTEVGFQRGLKRDSELNGKDNSQKWHDYYLPKEEEYVKAESPLKKADVVVDGNLPF